VKDISIYNSSEFKIIFFYRKFKSANMTVPSTLPFWWGTRRLPLFCFGLCNCHGVNLIYATWPECSPCPLSQRLRNLTPCRSDACAVETLNSMPKINASSADRRSQLSALLMPGQWLSGIQGGAALYDEVGVFMLCTWSPRIYVCK